MAAVVGFLAMRNYWPPKNGTEGAIGTANRYTAQQISDQDVMLKDPKVQAFLQSDTFHQLATNPDFKTFVEEGGPRQRGQGGGCREPEPDGRRAPGGSRSRERHRSAEGRLLLRAPGFQVEALLSKQGLALLGDAGFVQAIDNKKFQVGAAKGLPDALEAIRPHKGGEGYASRLEAFITHHPDMLTVLGDQGFGKWIKLENSTALVDALNKPAINSDMIAAALGNMDTRSIIVEGSFARLGESAAFISALKDEGFQKLLTNDLDLNKTLNLHD